MNKLVKKVAEMVKKYPVTPQQELFVLAYTTRGETFCNNTKSYAEAYQYDLPRRPDGSVDTTSSEYLACKANGGRMLFNPEIRSLIQNTLIEQFNEKTADARVAEVMLNGKDADALQAVKIFNDLKQRVTKKVDISVTARPMEGLSDEELLKLAND